MIPEPDLILYACIAKGPTILAEFISKDTELGPTAAACLLKTPPFHTNFTHTVRSRSYTFLIEDPFAYFVISDEKLEKPEALSFLTSVKDAFFRVSENGKKLEKLGSHCYQGEINPVFHHLLGGGFVLGDAEGVGSPGGRNGGVSGTVRARKEKGLKKMVDRLIGEFGGVGDDDGGGGGKGVGLSREFLMHKNGGLGGSGEMNGDRKVWKKQMWVVLTLDLVVCVVLFGVWLWVCSGFKCMNT